MLAAGRVRLALWLMPCLVFAIVGWGFGAEAHNLRSVGGWTLLILAIAIGIALWVHHSDEVDAGAQEAVSQALAGTSIDCANLKRAQRVVSSLKRTGAAQAPARMRASKVVTTLGARALASISLTPRLIAQRPLPLRG